MVKHLAPFHSHQQVVISFNEMNDTKLVDLVVCFFFGDDEGCDLSPSIVCVTLLNSVIHKIDVGAFETVADVLKLVDFFWWKWNFIH